MIDVSATAVAECQPSPYRSRDLAPTILPMPLGNTLFYGDNLTIMRDRMPSNSVDLIYLDPPFKSDQNYNLIYKTLTGKPVPEQAEAFCDTWDMDAEKAELAKRIPQMMRETGVQDYYIHFWTLWVNALTDVQPHLLAYLIYMVERLIWMKPILKETGSIYLHCDPAASHYIKVMMDGIFDHQHFQNEIIWKRTSAHSGAKRYGPIHDVILFYTKSDKYTWNKVFQPYDQQYVDAFFTHRDEQGRPWRRTDLTGPGTRKGDSGLPWKGIDPTERGRHWQPPSYFYDKYAELTGDDLANYPLIERLSKLDSAGLIHWPQKADGMPQGKRLLADAKGIPLQDIWTDIRPLHNVSKERLGYPTQKPVELMKRIIEASSRPGDTVFDPFCGCGTTIYAAQELGRTWVGCDVAILAVKIIRETLSDRYRLSEREHFEVDGIPGSVDGAQELFARDAHQFQHWRFTRLTVPVGVFMKRSIRRRRDRVGPTANAMRMITMTDRRDPATATPVPNGRRIDDPRFPRCVFPTRTGAQPPLHSRGVTSGPQRDYAPDFTMRAQALQKPSLSTDFKA